MAMLTGPCAIRLDVLDFGKHRGKHINQVDVAYLRWIVHNFSESHQWWKPAADALARTSKLKHQQRNVHVHVLVSELKSCARRKDLRNGRRIHTNAVEAGIDSNIYVAAALINMYAKCGNMVEARRVFDSVQEPDVVSWTVLIRGYVANGQALVALDLFSTMKDERRCEPDSVTYVAALKACTVLAAGGDETRTRMFLQRGRNIHSETGCLMDRFVQSALIDMYAKCGSIGEARTVFNNTPQPDVVCWNALILGYADSGQGLVALDLFTRMKEECKDAPESMTYVAVLRACTSLAANAGETGKRQCLERGREMHLESKLHMNRFVQATLIDMYAKCGSMIDARKVFDGIQEPDAVSWNALILGYAENEQGHAALDLFSRMKEEHRCVLDTVTYIAVLKACTSLAADRDADKEWCLERGRQIHLEIGCHITRFLQNTLIDMYSKCGSMVDAKGVFDDIREPDVVSWNALILGYADNGQSLVALDLFAKMEDECHCAPDCVTYVAALKACIYVGSLAIGRRLHSEIKEFDAHVVACLVDFYASCGSMDEARKVFDLHPRARDVATWNALLTGYSGFGDTGSVFELFEAMQEQGFRPNAVTFVCMLSCCSHAGLVDKALGYLEVMPRYGVAPALRHYSCMIDLLARANKLHEAAAVLRKTPAAADAVLWMTLLGACHKWKNSALGRLAFEALLDLDQTNAPAYVLMAEIYGSRGMWEEQERLLQSSACFKS